MLQQVNDFLGNYSATEIHTALIMTVLVTVAFIMVAGAFSGGKVD